MNTRQVLLTLPIAALLMGLPVYPVTADEAMQEALNSYEQGDYQQALEIWLLKAYEGDPEAQYHLGRMFADGTGTVVDLAEAVYWYTRSAEQGNPSAQFELGNAHFHGAGVVPDKKKALEWWHLAAENNNVDAQYHLGRAYFYGIDLTQNSQQAIEWFQRASQHGSQAAEDFLKRVGVSQGQEQQVTDTDWRGYGVVRQRALRIYASFNRHSAILGDLTPQSLVKVVNHKSGWFQVEIPGGLAVWVPRDSLDAAENGAVINRAGVPARQDPSDTSGVNPIGVFIQGDAVLPLEEKDDWVKIQAPEHIAGWVEAIEINELGLAEDEVEPQWQAARRNRLAAMEQTRQTVVLAAPAEAVEEVIEQEAGSAVSSEASQADGEQIVLAKASDMSEAEPGESNENISTEAPSVAADSAPVANPESQQQEESLEVEIASPADEIMTPEKLLELVASQGSQDWWLERATAENIEDGDYLRVGPVAQGIYTRNRLNSARIVELVPGSLVRVAERRRSWIRVGVPGGLPLWIFSRFIDHDGERGVITGRGVRARPLPSTSSNSQPVGNYPTGAEVEVIEVADQWVRIKAPESMLAWMPVDGLYLSGRNSEILLSEWQQQTDSDGQPVQITDLSPQSAESGTDADLDQDSDAVSEQDSALGDEPDVSGEDSESQIITETDSSETQEVADSTLSGDPASTETEVTEADQAVDENNPVKVEDQQAVEQADTSMAVEENTGEVPDTEVTEESDAELRAADTKVEAPIEVDEASTDSVSSGTDGSLSGTEDVSGINAQASDSQVIDESVGNDADTVLIAQNDATLNANDSEFEVSEAVTPSGDAVDSQTDQQSASEVNASATGNDAEQNESLTAVATLQSDQAKETQTEVDNSEATDNPGNDSVDNIITQIDESAELLVANDSTTQVPDTDQSIDESIVATGTESGESATDDGATMSNDSAGNIPETDSVAVETAETVEPQVANEVTEQTDSENGEEAAPQQGSEAVEHVAQNESEARVDTAEAADTTNTVANAVAFDDLDWLYRQASDAFSIELIRGVSQEQVVGIASGVNTDAPLVSYSSNDNGERQFNLLLGAYEDLRAVNQALGSLQGKFEDIRIRRLGAIQSERCKQLDNLTPEQLLVVLNKCVN